MKYVQFDYVNKFSCLAGKCPDTCCKDWQIILDEDAIARYASLPGELGEQVRAAMLTENGETRFRERGGNCVLLRDDGLCPLQAAYGAEMLCRTCFTHPRFTEEYGQTAELTLSASCPEAARLLLEHDAPLTLTETDDGGPVIPNELDPALYPALLAARTASIRLAQDRARPVADRLALILLLARRVQRLLDEGRDELVPVLARRFLGKQYQDRSLVRLARLRSRSGRFFPCWMVLNNMEHLTRRFGVMLDAAVFDISVVLIQYSVPFVALGRAVLGIARACTIASHGRRTQRIAHTAGGVVLAENQPFGIQVIPAYLMRYGKIRNE